MSNNVAADSQAIRLAQELLIPFQDNFHEVCEAASGELVRQHNDIESLKRALSLQPEGAEQALSFAGLSIHTIELPGVIDGEALARGVLRLCYSTTPHHGEEQPQADSVGALPTEAVQELVAFAQTAPGRLPSRVQEAIATLSGLPSEPAAAEAVRVPHPGSPEASAMMDSMLSEYNYPSNPKNCARAGYVAAQRLLSKGHPRHAKVMALAGEMAEQFEIHHGAGTWTDPDYRQDARTWGLAWRTAQAHAAPSPQQQGAEPVAVEVWFGSMPESNGRENWTVTLRRKDRPENASKSDLHRLMSGVSVYRSEYKDRARYEADRLRFLLGEVDEAPDIRAYDAELHSGYIAAQQQAAEPVAAPFAPALRARTLLALLWRGYDAAGESMGRSRPAMLLEAAMELLGDPNPADLQRCEDPLELGNLVDETRSWLSARRAERLGFPATPQASPRPAPPQAAASVQAVPFGEIQRLAQVAVRECPPDTLMVTDWMDCAMKVCRAIATHPAGGEPSTGSTT